MGNLPTLDESEILNRVYKLVADQLPEHWDKLSPDARFAEDLGADSLDITELVVAFEDEFGVEIPDEDLAGLTTIRAVVDYILRATRG
ncbi:acyl carrier protein [Alicyclobacillus macrosporangiidus]|uniref:acyl carrier protein n=1 Tax=Alicyclobacillus macrosporangiidus TaxID=392015 RepID=UPI0034E94742